MALAVIVLVALSTVLVPRQQNASAEALLRQATARAGDGRGPAAGTRAGLGGPAGARVLRHALVSVEPGAGGRQRDTTVHPDEARRRARHPHPDFDFRADANPLDERRARVGEGAVALVAAVVADLVAEPAGGHADADRHSGGMLVREPDSVILHRWSSRPYPSHVAAPQPRGRVPPLRPSSPPRIVD